MDTHDLRVAIGRRIRNIRAGRSLKAFVAAFNSTPPTDIRMDVSSLHRYEAGKTRISLEKFWKILKM